MVATSTREQRKHCDILAAQGPWRTSTPARPFMHAPHTCAWPTWWPAAPCSAAAPTSAALPWFSSPISALVLAARAAFFPVCAAESGSSARTRGHPPPSAPRTPTMQKRAGAWDADGHARVRRALQTHTAAECAHTIRAHRGDLRCAAGRRHPSRPTITPFSHLSRPSLPDFLLTLTSTSLVDATNLFTTKQIALHGNRAGKGPQVRRVWRRFPLEEQTIQAPQGRRLLREAGCGGGRT